MKIEKCVKKLEKQIVKDKKFLWDNPEKGNEEFLTSEYIVNRLKEMGYEVKDHIGTTGVLAMYEGKKKGPCILFRSELDALEMDDEGRMQHACGHDAHMTAMLGLAKLIMDNKERIKGTIKLAFEPAEETAGGAKTMIKEGILENPKVDYVFGIHFWSELKKGNIGIKEGAIMASTDPFDITVHGRGGHGALPEKCVDPIYIASSIVMGLQAIVARNISPDETVTLGITSIHGGSTNNLIPEKVEMKGICRMFNNGIREYVKSRICEIATSTAKGMNAKVDIKFREDNYPAAVNDKEITKKIKNAIENILDDENAIIDDYKTMCSDDIAFLLQKRPGTFILVGCTDKEYYPQHSEKFLVDTESIIIGVQVLYEIVKKLMF